MTVHSDEDLKQAVDGDLHKHVCKLLWRKEWVGHDNAVFIG